MLRLLIVYSVYSYYYPPRTFIIYTAHASSSTVSRTVARAVRMQYVNASLFIL